MSENVSNIDDLEYGIIGCLLDPLNREHMVTIAENIKFKSEFFANPELHTAYDILIGLKHNDRNLCINELGNRVSSETIKKATDNGFVGLPDLGSAMKKVKNAGLKRWAVNRILSKNVNDSVSGFYNLQDVMDEISRKLRETESIDPNVEGVPLSGIPIPPPEEEDPNSLIKSRYLEKGQALILVAKTNDGKSSIVMQLAYAWALGRTVLGFTPTRPMRIAVFQTEDSSGDVYQCKTDMRKGFKRFMGWTDEDADEAESRVVYYEKKHWQSSNFFSFFRRVQRSKHFDLAVINPLGGIAKFDISDNTQARDFVRDKIDDIIKDDELKCGLIIVNHTNKPPTGPQQSNTDQFAQYQGAGGAELPNWARAVLVLKQISASGQFELIAAKRGKKLGWPAIPGKKYYKPTRLIRYSTPEEDNQSFWHDVSSADATPAATAPTTADVLDANAGKLAAELKMNALTLTDARNHAKGILGDNPGNAAYNHLLDHLSKFSVIIKRTGKGCQKVIGSDCSIKKYFFEMNKKVIEEAKKKL